MDFLQDVAFGKKEATEAEVEKAVKELSKYMPDLEPQLVQHR